MTLDWGGDAVDNLIVQRIRFCELMWW